MVKFVVRDKDDEEFDQDMKELVTNKDSSVQEMLLGIYLQNQQILSLLREQVKEKDSKAVREKNIEIMIRAKNIHYYGIE